MTDEPKQGSNDWQMKMQLSPLEAATLAARQATRERIEREAKAAYSEQLRDQMAMAALQGLGTWMPIEFNRFEQPDLKKDEALKARADWAYRQADAMLEARKS